MKIVNAFPAGESGKASLKPMVVTVIVVMYRASKNEASSMRV